jgi:hypothetical protein
MSQSNNTKLQPAYSAYKIATFPSNLLEHILSEVYNLCDPYFDIVEKESTKFVKAVSLELTTLFVTGSSLFLTEDISPKFNLSRDYKTYLKDNLHPDLGIHSDANYYVNDRMSLFLSEILALNKDENLHDITFLSALLIKWPLTEEDVIRMEIQNYDELGIHVFEPLQCLLFKEMIKNSFGFLCRSIVTFLNIEYDEET